MRPIHAVVLVAGVMLAPVWARAQAPAGLYTDEFNGFSLQPPAGVERLRETSPRRLVCWARRDPKTRAIRWSLEVLRTRHEPSKLPPKEYADAIARQLASVSRFHVESTELGKVAGKPAMHFRGIWKGALELWRRQTWVQINPDEYLVLNIAGPIADKAEMDKALTRVAGSLKLFDPSAVLKERAENLARGSALLAGLDEAKLRAVLAEEPSYYLVQLKGKPIGFVKITETVGNLGPDRGLRVIRAGALKLPGEPRRLTREELFATADRKVERWRRIVIDGEGTAAVKSVSEAIKQQDVLLMQTKRSDRPLPSRQRKVPAAIRPAYLPVAFDGLVPRLMDRTRAVTYGFAVYNAAANDFDLRLVRVIGPEKITFAGRRVDTVRLGDRMAQDAPWAELWVDEKGLLLRMATPDGPTMYRAGRKAVAATFGAELGELEKMGS